MNQATRVTAPTLRTALEQAQAQILRFLACFPSNARALLHYHGYTHALNDTTVLELFVNQRDAPQLSPDDWPREWAAYYSVGYHTHEVLRYALSAPTVLLLQRAMAIATVRFEGAGAFVPLMDLDGFDGSDGDVFLNWVNATPVESEANIPGLPVPFSAFTCAHEPTDQAYYRSRPGFVPVPLDEPLWKVRERLRMALHYQALPQPLLDVLPPEVLEDEFPHIATKAGNAGMIAYTASAQAGIMDRQQVIKPGRYVRMHCPHLTDEQVKRLAAEVAGALDAGIHVSHDPDDFERVYRRGPSSCMAYGPEGKAFGRLIVDGEFFHPTRVYAHPDNNIRLVWVEQNGRIGARTLVNTRTMKYPQLYYSDGVARARDRLLLWLEANGYTQASDALRGEKLLKVHPDDYPNAIICPYIDVHNQGVEIHDDHLVVRGPYQANHETGCLADFDTHWSLVPCECCGDLTDPDEVVHSADGPICPCCRDRHYIEAWDPGEHRSQWVHYDDSDLYALAEGARQRFNYYDYICVASPSSLGLVELCTAHYDYDYGQGIVAREEDCVETEDGDWILTRDAQDFGLFVNEDDDTAYLIRDWIILIDEDGDWELLGRDEADFEALEQTTDYPSDCPYAMLDCYRVLPAEVEEEKPEAVSEEVA